jgi:hypothetical protein
MNNDSMNNYKNEWINVIRAASLCSPYISRQYIKMKQWNIN